MIFKYSFFLLIFALYILCINEDDKEVLEYLNSLWNLGWKKVDCRSIWEIECDKNGYVTSLCVL